MIRFLRDFRSQHTGENFYEAGQSAEFGPDAERALIAEGAAEFVPITPRAGQVDPTAEPEPVSEQRVVRGRKGLA